MLMKKFTVALFDSARDAENAIAHIHQKLDIPVDEISYIVRSADGATIEKDADDVAGKTAGEGASAGAATGGALGATAGIIAAVGVIPGIGPVIAAGPLAVILGLIGTVGGGTAAGAAAGGLIGALTTMGVSEDRAESFTESIESGDAVLVTVHAEEEKNISSVMLEYNARTVESYEAA